MAILITTLPDINVVIVTPVSMDIQVRKGSTFREPEVKNNPVSNNEPDVEEIGDHQEIVRPLYVPYGMLKRGQGRCKYDRVGNMTESFPSNR